MAIFLLESTIRHYDWGGTRTISDLLGRKPDGRPEAELWMGAHPSAPSSLVDASDEGAKDLGQLLEASPELLGPQLQQLPYLFKVLCAASPLSLQVHPSIEMARAGFARENQEGVPISASERCYKDESHKPELILALSPFYALCGFAPPKLIGARLEYYGLLEEGSVLAADARRLLAQSSPSTLSRFFARLFQLSPGDLSRLVEGVGMRARRDADSGERDSGLVGRSARLLVSPTALKRFSQRLVALANTYPEDPGVLGALLLHWVELHPGQALYLPAGVLHSYLEGVGLEIMASSDNVLRGGLTSKHVSVPELQRTVNFVTQEPHLVVASDGQEPGGALVSRYVTPASEFELSLLRLDEVSSLEGRGPDILIVLEGSVEASSGGRSVELHKGQQAFCSGNEIYTLRGNSRIARASTNPHA